MELLVAITAVLAAVAAIASAVCLKMIKKAAGALSRDGQVQKQAADDMGTVLRQLSDMQRILTNIAQGQGQVFAVERERFETLSREFARLDAKLVDTRREMQQQLIGTREATEARVNELRDAVDRQLTAIRVDNERQLDRIRATVDEKLQATLETGLARSFKQVSDQLEAVYKGLGDMQSVAAGVGDLKRVLGNVKTRGMLGEVQLGALLAEILAPDQYEENVATRPGSAERVEFAVKLPQADAEAVLLPIDAKFPGDTYGRLREAVDAGDAEGASAARRALVQRIKSEAKDIAQKYISVPDTTNFAILFLPFEGLYAEVVDTPGLIEALQRDYRVNVAGPSTMAALLNSLQMSYQTFAFQRRADEIQQVLAAVKAELPRYQKALQNAHNQIARAGTTVEKLMTTRTRAIERKLRDVTALADESEAASVLGIEGGIMGIEAPDGEEGDL